MKDPVEGTARVVSSSAPPHAAKYANCSLHLVIEAPGVAAFAAETSKNCRVARWPQAGMVLPCQVDRSRPDRYEIDVKSIPDWREQAREQAEWLAAQHNTGTITPPSGGPSAPPIIQVHGAATPEQAADAIRLAEEALGVDLDGDGVVGGAATGAGAAGGSPLAAPSSRGDVISQLERLAALRDAGALSEAEFAEQKARLLAGE